MARGDPRHGIWILPLVIVAMVGSTAAFVNSLNPGEVPGGSTSTAPDNGTPGTSTTTTTVPVTVTTLAPEVVAYLAEIDVLAATGTELVDRATAINSNWDDRAITFGQAVDQMEELAQDANLFQAAVETALPDIPRLEPAHLDVVTAARAMSEAATGMLEGLQDPVSSQGRRDSLESFLTHGASLQAAIGVVRATAGAPAGSPPPDAATTTTEPDFSEDPPGIDE